MTKLLEGKRGIIMGVANQKSIAWSIAENLAAHGAELAFTYAGEILEKRVKPLAESVNSPFITECDVTSDESIEETFANLHAQMGKIDFVVHAIAFSDKDELKGKYLHTSRDNFKLTMDISAYSFTAVAAAAEPYLNDGASLITLSYYGAEKYVSNYNVMGVAKAALEASVLYLANDLGERQIRVNSISAGPIKTLAASGIGGFRKILAHNEAHAPLKRNVTADEVGKTALWLVSDLASGVTGENIHVDCGASTIGVSVEEENEE